MSDQLKYFDGGPVVQLMVYPKIIKKKYLPLLLMFLLNNVYPLLHVSPEMARSVPVRESVLGNT